MTWFTDHYAMLVVALGAGTLGIVSGTLGAFAVLRKQSLLGDAISHAALPGIVLAFLWTQSKQPLVLVAGASLAGWLGTLLVMSIVRTTRVAFDSALGLVLSVFFGFGLMLLTYLQKQGAGAAQAGLANYLFGQAGTLLLSDVASIALLGAIAVVLVGLLWKEFKLLSFDPEFGATLGWPMQRLDVLLTSLLVIAIVIGLQTVGVVLMSAMIVAPAAAARQWTDRLGLMVWLAAGFGALSGISGAVLSSQTRHLPAGPTIVLCASGLVLASLLAAPQRGLVWGAVRQWRQRRQLHLEAILGDLYDLAQQHHQPDYPHAVAMLQALHPDYGGVKPCLAELRQRGLVRQVGRSAWALTAAGVAEAQRLREQQPSFLA